MKLFSNKKKKTFVRTSASSRGKGKRENSSVLSLWIETLTFLIFAFILYVLASIFSLRTGIWGDAIRFSLLRNWGGAILIPVFFGGYLCIAYFLKTGAKGLLSQALGTLLLFLCTALLFGLFQTARIFQGFPLFTPGYLGQGLAVFLTREIGVLGTTLLAVALWILSATLYGFIHPASVISRISKMLHSFRSLSIPKRNRNDTEIVLHKEILDEKTGTEEEAGLPSRFVLVRPPSHGIPADVLQSIEETQLPEEQLPQEGAERFQEGKDRTLFNFFTRKRNNIPEDEDVFLDTMPPSPANPVVSSDALAEVQEQFDVVALPDVYAPPADQEEKNDVSENAPDAEEDAFILRRPEETLSQYEHRAELPVRDSGGVDDNEEETEGVRTDPHALPDIEFHIVEEEGPVRIGTFPPPPEIFGPRQEMETSEDNETVREQASSIITTLADFGVSAEMADVVIGPTVIQFQLQLAPGIKVSKVAGLSNDLAVALTVPSLRVEAPIPGKPYVGVEIPNPKRKGIALRTILESRVFLDSENDLPLAMGVRVDSRPLVVGLEDLPHLLVAGTTGSGKSVFVTSCITGLCTHRTPEELRLILIDPKRVELSIYEHLPHVLAKPVVSPKKAVQALAWAVREMEHRYEIFARARVRNLKSYNQNVLPKAKLPHIVIVVDELADLMFTAQKDVEDYICRLAQMARATGIHLVLATQRPSVNVITGLIKANIPARVAFTLPSQTDSRTIIDVSGAERLLGKGDMLFVSSKYPRPLRLQAPFIEDGKSLEIIEYLGKIFGPPEYVDIEAQGAGESTNNGDTSFAEDPLLEEAVDIVMETGIASASRLQRQLRVGFTRAARLVDTMEQIGIVGPPEGSKPREILVDDETARSLLSRVLSGEAE